MSLLDINETESQLDEKIVNASIIDFIKKYYGQMESYYESYTIIRIRSYIEIYRKAVDLSIIYHNYKSHLGLMDSYIFIEKPFDHLRITVSTRYPYPDNQYHSSCFPISMNDGTPIQFKHVLEFLNNYRADKCSKHYNFHYKKYMA